MSHPPGWTVDEPCPSCGSWDMTDHVKARILDQLGRAGERFAAVTSDEGW